MEVSPAHVSVEFLGLRKSAKQIRQRRAEGTRQILDLVSKVLGVCSATALRSRVAVRWSV